MIVKIFTLKKGLEEVKDVEAIRLRCREYNLLIMKDYIPIIGKIDGNVEIEYNNQKMSLTNIKAFYMCSDNIFNLLIEGE